ncbi:vanadium-dependent haloperoxidase [Tabrizicola oligotrophica]|uniref:Vanadium-dependent haloperoxidase n=1 Tax=Tabrizicola oligotrophica TaxID=2710650 RepID=A0A6M0QWX0_9RHOB|nr:vanadium-dependent haloperoxidase [Tabrizicola oligotrophica]NEY91955.1 vanadium-dependent haloperoxidase [Tabrizicola oligotrophica]
MARTPAFPSRRSFLQGGLAGVALTALPLPASATARRAEQVLGQWYQLLLELIRHTATYSPPVAARSFAYLGVTAFEALATGNPALRSLSGQVRDLAPLPAREAAPHDEACVLQGALTHAMAAYFGNTGPTGQRAMQAMEKRLSTVAMEGVGQDVAARSVAHGLAVSQAILDWSAGDGGAVIENMGFPMSYALTEGPAHWVPTSTVAVQQAPLLPTWGQNRTFAIPETGPCGLPPPLAYSEDPASDFYAQAKEVYDTSKALTDEQKLIARFWSDDPMLSPTPPGHWVSILLQIFDRDGTPVDRQAELLALLGMTISDAFVQCWRSKFEHDLLRPVTYIRRVIDPKWEPLLNTPPFPEYPSGHSTQSAAAATVLEGLLGQDFAFDDATHADEGLPTRHFDGFWQAAEEAALSRMYGGIHFRAANENGLAQGKCVAAHVLELKTRA